MTEKPVRHKPAYRCARDRRKGSLPGNTACGDAGVVHQHIGRQASRMSDSQERFHVRMAGDRPIRLPVAEMTPEDARLALEFAERELQLVQANAAPAVALLQRIADGDRSMSRWQLRRARETVTTLVQVQQQTDRLRAVVRVMQTGVD
jgi:hypothetical protein